MDEKGEKDPALVDRKSPQRIYRLILEEGFRIKVRYPKQQQPELSPSIRNYRFVQS